MPELNIIDNPHNRQVIASLMAVYRIYARSWGRERAPEPSFSTECDLSDLRTHPDLGGALNMAAIDLPGVTSGLVMGYQVIVNSTGIIFAVAMSMFFLAVRLPPAGKNFSVCPEPSHPDIDFGDGWVTANPWDKEALHQLLADSLAYVNQMVGEAAE